MAELLQSIGQAAVDGYKGIESFFVGGYNGIENFFVNGWASFLDFLLNTVGLKAFWETITNIKF